MTDSSDSIPLTLAQYPTSNGDEATTGYRVESPAFEKAVGGETVPDVLRNLAGLVEDDVIDLQAVTEAPES